jgi:precorrin-6A synthase (deacetylating)
LKMRRVFIIGIGAGNPDYVTVQAINALNEVDVFFVIDKGREKEDLVRLRKEICDRYIKDKSYRTIEVRDPERDRTASSYEAGVKAWHEQRAAIYERLIGQELGEKECGVCGVIPVFTTARYGSSIKSPLEETSHSNTRWFRESVAFRRWPRGIGSH